MPIKNSSMIQDYILEFLKDAPRGLSTTQITQLLNENGIQISRVSVRKYLLELFGQGIVQRDKIGVARVWYLAPEEERGPPLISPSEWEIIDQILNYLDNQDYPRSIQEIAISLEINRNTIANILRVMAKLGLVDEHGQGRNSLWRVRASPSDLRQIHPRIAVVLVECNCQKANEDPDDTGTVKNEKNKIEDEQDQEKPLILTLNVLSMNSTARDLAGLQENIPSDLRLEDLEIQMFQRPLMSKCLRKRVEKVFITENDRTWADRDKLPQEITVRKIFPRLERERNTFWKTTAQIEAPLGRDKNEPPRFLITYQDITAKFQLKHLIWRSAQSFQEFFKDLSVPVALITPDFKIIDGNDEFQKMIGVTERFWGYHCFSVFRGKSKPCDDCPILTGGLPREVLTTNSPIRVDGQEIIYFPGEPTPRTYRVRVIANISQTNNNQISSYFLILQPIS